MRDYAGCRWTLRNLEGDVRGPLTDAGDEVEVMPVREHREIRDAAQAVVDKDCGTDADAAEFDEALHLLWMALGAPGQKERDSDGR